MFAVRTVRAAIRANRFDVARAQGSVAWHEFGAGHGRSYSAAGDPSQEQRGKVW
jgi:hypothetical protein